MQTKLGSKLSTLEFLWNSAKSLKTESRLNGNLKVIQAQLRDKCLSLSRGGRGGYDCSSAFRESESCRFCGTPWAEGSFRLRISPHQYKMRRLKKKLESNLANLSEYEKHLLDFFSKRQDNVLVKRCTTCSMSTKVGMRKVPPRENVEVAAQESIVLSESRKRSKKRKKDRFSGLVPAAVVGARTEVSDFLTPTSQGTLSENIERDNTTPVGGLKDCESQSQPESETSSPNFCDISIDNSSFKSNTNSNSSFICSSTSISCSTKKKKKHNNLDSSSLSQDSLNVKNNNNKTTLQKSINISPVSFTNNNIFQRKYVDCGRISNGSQNLKQLDQGGKKSKKKKKSSLVSDFLNLL